MSIFIAALGFGLVSASVLALAAVAFTMQFGITDLINVAFGPIMIACAYVAYVLNSRGLNIWIAMLVAGMAGAVISVVLNRRLYAPLQRRGVAQFTLIVVSLAVALVVQNICLALAGADNVSYTMDPGTIVRFGGLTLSTVELEIIGIAVIAMLALDLLLRRTYIGKAMRATRSNATLARASGIRTGRIVDLVWIITGFIAGISGTVFAINAGTFSPSAGTGLMVTILAAAFLGGVGEPYGAMIGGLFVGIATELSALFWSSAYKQVAAFGLLVIVLLLRPKGLFSRRSATSGPN
jgi:branched-subunit amino acid ABC-type transport system permease component